MKFRCLGVLGFTTLSVFAQEGTLSRAWKIIEDAHAQNNSIQRSQLLNALSAAGTNPRTIAILEAGLSDKSSEVRQAAAAVLGDVKSRSSIPKLTAALDDEAAEVSFTAARSLWNMGDLSGRDIFMEVLAGERGNSPGLVKGSMRQVKHRLHNPASLAMLGVKEGAGMFLGPFSMGIMVFEELRKDGSASARTLATVMLASDSDPASIRNLEEALSDKNWIVRAAAAKALAARGSRDSVPNIEPLLSEDRHRVRYVAAAAIVALAGQAVPQAEHPAVPSTTVPSTTTRIP
ncbi:MAG TPA: HEAT repeat domain-containing protein [Bryobacteraceae bacterium]|nr:HEAT repeat domain-containing protein [Bryobacteraceae bacterium]